MREMIDFNGEKLRLLREKKCLTQRELASRAGISQVCLSRMECNHIIPRRAMCEKLAWVLRVDPDEFFGPADETLDEIENHTRMFEKVRAIDDLNKLISDLAKALTEWADKVIKMFENRGGKKDD